MAATNSNPIKHHGDTNQSSSLIDIDQTFHYRYGTIGLGFVRGGSIKDRAMKRSVSGRHCPCGVGGGFTAKSRSALKERNAAAICRRPSGICSPPTFSHGISAASYKKLHWRYPAVVRQLVDGPACWRLSVSTERAEVTPALNWILLEVSRLLIACVWIVWFCFWLVSF